MTDTVSQVVWDSEQDYVNTTHWHISPLFRLIKNGETEQLRQSLDLALDRYDYRQRITKDERKQLEYMAVSLVNTFMIAAIEGGVYPPEANWAADRALRRLLYIKKPAEISPIVSEVALELCDMVRATKENDTGNTHVEQAKHFMLTHITQDIAVAAIANHVGLSTSHLSRLFKARTGQTLHAYLTAERLRMAERLLLTTDDEIRGIAVLLRFCDQSHFTQAFRKRYGMTPAAYRNCYRRKA